MSKEHLSKKVDFNIGGQAVFEGVMFRGKNRWSIAVRKPDGEIVAESFDLKGVSFRSRYGKVPVVRGVLLLVDTLSLGFKAIKYAAEKAFDEEVEVSNTVFTLNLIIALALAVFLFVLLPLWTAKFVVGTQTASNSLLFSTIEGLVRLFVFILYLIAISFMPDMRRVFQYHGAEHKVIHAFEHGESLEPESAIRYSPLHVSCGTSFIIIVLIIMVFIHAFIRGNFFISFLIRLSLIPVVAGISYEIIRFARKHEGNPLVMLFSAPGLLVQKLTTREPDITQLEVATTALKELLKAEGLMNEEKESEEVVKEK